MQYTVTKTMKTCTGDILKKGVVVSEGKKIGDYTIFIEQEKADSFYLTKEEIKESLKKVMS